MKTIHLTYIMPSDFITKIAATLTFLNLPVLFDRFCLQRAIVDIKSGDPEKYIKTSWSLVHHI